MNYLFVLAVLLPHISIAQTRCTSTTDCLAGEEYCAGGECLGVGNCTQVSDCFNPNNSPFASLACVGYMDCNEDGQCGMVCGEQQCANEQDFAPCDPENLPCDEAECAEAEGCFNDPCSTSGECAAVFYDASGNIVCNRAGAGTVGPPPAEPGSDLDSEILCLRDSDCDGVFNDVTAYCSQGVCLAMGSCLEDVDCVNPSNIYAVIGCVGLLQCDADTNLCGRQCGPSFCPEDVPEAECPSDPCVDFKFGCFAAASCASNICGECSPILFDEAGFVLDAVEDCNAGNGTTAVGGDAVDTPSDPIPVMDSEVLCLRDSDCDGVFNDVTAYCSQGVCLAMGSCLEDVDCVNPSNIYAVVGCVGQLQCDADTNICGRECGPSFCPEGVPEVECPSDPCLDFKFGCFAASSCASNICGECSPILFDEAGFVLDAVEDCNGGNVTDAVGFAVTTCSSDLDCGFNGTEYCAHGNCLPMGQCKERIDCWNPANGPYPLPACIGLRDCLDGVCGMICGPEQCPGEEIVPCEPATECNIANCDGAVGCDLDGCGGECTEIFFDESGTQICKKDDGDANVQECTSNDDCVGTSVGRADGEESYCAQGICLEKGSCVEDIDCMNPSNVYPALDCVGYTSCQASRCVITCGPACADGSDSSICEPLPCDNTTCAAGVTCANDACNGCNAIFFDAGGNKVENCDTVNFQTNKDPDTAFAAFSVVNGMTFFALSVVSWFLV